MPRLFEAREIVGLAIKNLQVKETFVSGRRGEKT